MTIAGEMMIHSGAWLARIHPRLTLAHLCELQCGVSVHDGKGLIGLRMLRQIIKIGCSLALLVLVGAPALWGERRVPPPGDDRSSAAPQSRSFGITA